MVLALWVPTLPGSPQPGPGVWGVAGSRCPVVATPVRWLSPGPASVLTPGVCSAPCWTNVPRWALPCALGTECSREHEGGCRGRQSRVSVRASLFTSGRSPSVWLKKIRNLLASIMKSWMAACRVPCHPIGRAPAELTTLSAEAWDQGRRVVPACVPGCLGTCHPPAVARVPSQLIVFGSGLGPEAPTAEPDPNLAMLSAPSQHWLPPLPCSWGPARHQPEADVFTKRLCPAGSV